MKLMLRLNSREGGHKVRAQSTIQDKMVFPHELDLSTPTLFKSFLRFGLFLGLIFQFIRILAAIFSTSRGHEQEEATEQKKKPKGPAPQTRQKPKKERKKQTLNSLMGKINSVAVKRFKAGGHRPPPEPRATKKSPFEDSGATPTTCALEAPVASGGAAGGLGRPELHTTLSLRAALHSLKETDFNSKKAVKETLCKSERIKSLINARATEGAWFQH
ncbi:unnamed protein product [Menidia menidia]|uniref:(Atlantic silverside) hypothetical protein n=1 Tax=Menidia menidia TaxID=238744 RepID=A0A8S4AZ16_9TELE|nr:unnamed protein product [Menidia menidia]